VTFEAGGGPADQLLQTKHHLSRTASLSDASPDLWKSLRIWVEGNRTKTIPRSASLHLLTTAVASPGSAAAYLRATEGRDVESAVRALHQTAQSSLNDANAPAYAAFLGTPPSEQIAVVERVVVNDGQASILGLDVLLISEVFWAVGRAHQDLFLERLEGWWLRRVLKQLLAVPESHPILAAEIEAELNNLREQFKQDSLPIDDDIVASTADQGLYAGYAFVHQLKFAGAGSRRIAFAVRDYYRAFEQRSRWVRQDLLIVGDLERYERQLTEAWGLVFEAIRDSLGDDAVDAAKIAAAREVLSWAESALIPIRPNVTAAWMTRGSLHLLADAARVGWHVDFRERLRALLETPGGEAA